MDAVKKYWKKATVYGVVVVVLGGLFWEYEIGGKELSALSRLPLLEMKVAQLDKEGADILAELKELNAQREEQGKLIALMVGEIKYLVKHSDEMRGDIKELLQR